MTWQMAAAVFLSSASFVWQVGQNWHCPTFHILTACPHCDFMPSMMNVFMPVIALQEVVTDWWQKHIHSQASQAYHSWREADEARC